jgi:hypothetical protein
MFPSLEDVARVGSIANPSRFQPFSLTRNCKSVFGWRDPLEAAKTRPAYAVTEAIATTFEQLRCYEGINEEKEIGKIRRIAAAALDRVGIEIDKSGFGTTAEGSTENNFSAAGRFGGRPGMKEHAFC